MESPQRNYFTQFLYAFHNSKREPRLNSQLAAYTLGNHTNLGIDLLVVPLWHVAGRKSSLLHDQAGKTWGSMDPTTEDNTFAYSIVFDNTAPALESWTPAKDMTYMLTPSGDFVLTVDAMDVNLFGLELDHSLEGVLPEFWVYADADPYGGEVAGFTAAGLAVTYNATTQTWTLTFENGGAALDAIIANQGITFYAVIHDLAGNKWGSMYNVTPDNTFAYTLYQQQPIARADSTGGDNVVAVVTADGNTINFTGEVAWYPADPY